jgi:hypothetical protein
VIPAFIDIGASWKVLPPGVHDATLQEVQKRFAINEGRERLFSGLFEACRSLAAAGCTTIYLDGSYVTSKPDPGDYDACWDPIGVDIARLDPILRDFSDQRRRQKDRYSGELFPSSARADRTHPFTDYFQFDKETGKKKGIIRVHLLPADGRNSP